MVTSRSTLSVTLGGVSRPLTRAQLGLSHVEGRVVGCYVEAHAGGDPGCPSPSSPTPDRTLIIAGIPLVASGGVVTELDGVQVSLLDFVGDQLAGAAPEQFTSVTLRVAQVITSPPDAAYLEAELTATSARGNVSGHFVARRCASLDG